MVDSESIKISYALGEAKPKHIIAFPLHANGMVGVIEMATVSKYTERDLTFFESINKNIAIAFQVAQSRRNIQELLKETQSQSEELRVQHTELESMNAEFIRMEISQSDRLLKLNQIAIIQLQSLTTNPNIQKLK